MIVHGSQMLEWTFPYVAVQLMKLSIIYYTYLLTELMPKQMQTYWTILKTCKNNIIANGLVNRSFRLIRNELMYR